MDASKARIVYLLPRVVGGWLLFVWLSAWFVYEYAHIDEIPMPDATAQAWVRSALRAMQEGEPLPKAPAQALSYRANPWFIVRAWYKGHRLAEVMERSALGVAIPHAYKKMLSQRRVARHLKKNVSSEERVEFSVGIVRGYGPLLLNAERLTSLSAVRLLDGIEVCSAERCEYATPEDMVLHDNNEDGALPTPIPEVRFGGDVEAWVRALSHKLNKQNPAGKLQVRRFRLSSLHSSVYPREVPVNETTLRQAAQDGARFLLRHQKPDGAYTYVYHARSNTELPEPYNLPRHAGTTYFLAQIARIERMADVRQGAIAAMEWIDRNHMRRCGGEALWCVESGGNATVGAAALTMMALAEILKGGEHPRSREMMEGLARFLRSLQRPDGELKHVYDLHANQALDVQRLYYSGEAALALLLAYEALHHVEDLNAARRLMAHLTGAGWNFFGSRYYYGEEHWTCQAAGAAATWFVSRQATDFCVRWANYNRRLQFRQGETPWSVQGGYGASPFFLPRITPVASRTEAFISTYELLRAQKLADEDLRAQVQDGLSMMLRYQWAPGPTYLFRDAQGAHGGFPGSPADLKSRNDFVQHAASAMIRWAEILKRERMSAQ